MSASPKRPTLRWLVAGAVLVALVVGAVAAADPDGSGSVSRHSRSVSRGSGRVAAADGSGVSAIGSAATAGETTPHGACGAASARTIAGVYDRVARRIYVGEIHGGEVRADIAHVTGSRELLSALASSNVQAVRSAVYGIVYMPHWHIVRLRVAQHGRVLADVGGPYIIAPISGPLFSHGSKVGTFTMSVQDDVGY
ncbi:MAG TPA: hypothetical protein VIG42_01785, partial [Solirubrobacteraceae bacterium]